MSTDAAQQKRNGQFSSAFLLPFVVQCCSSYTGDTNRQVALLTISADIPVTQFLLDEGYQLISWAKILTIFLNIKRPARRTLTMYVTHNRRVVV